MLAYEPPERIVFSWDINPMWQIESDLDKTSEVAGAEALPAGLRVTFDTSSTAPTGPPPAAVKNDARRRTADLDRTQVGGPSAQGTRRVRGNS